MASTYAPWSNFPAPGSSAFPKGTLTATLVKALSAADMAALRTSIQATYPGVALTYEGPEFAYTVVIAGRAPYFNNAYLALVPRGRPDIIRQRSDIATP